MIWGQKIVIRANDSKNFKREWSNYYNVLMYSENMHNMYILYKVASTVSLMKRLSIQGVVVWILPLLQLLSLPRWYW